MLLADARGGVGERCNRDYSAPTPADLWSIAVTYESPCRKFCRGHERLCGASKLCRGIFGNFGNDLLAFRSGELKRESLTNTYRSFRTAENKNDLSFTSRLSSARASKLSPEGKKRVQRTDSRLRPDLAERGWRPVWALRERRLCSVDAVAEPAERPPCCSCQRLSVSKRKIVKRVKKIFFASPRTNKAFCLVTVKELTCFSVVKKLTAGGGGKVESCQEEAAESDEGLSKGGFQARSLLSSASSTGRALGPFAGSAGLRAGVVVVVVTSG